MAVKVTNKLQKPGKSVKNAVKTARPKRGNTIGVFIDLDNTNASLDNILEIFSTLKYKGEIVFGKFYGYTDNKTEEFEDFVAEHRLDTIGRMRFKVDGTSVVDPRLVIDSIGFAEKNGADMVFVWAGVGDLIPLFSEIVKAGCKTITVDLPEFDCNNKFVDEKIKLFSPHSLDATSKANKRQNNQASEDDTVDFEEDFSEDADVEVDTSFSSSLMGDRKIPQLPRKKGAPEFGAKSESSFADTFDDVDYNDEDDYEDDFEDEDFDLDNFDDDDEDDDEEEEEDDDGINELNILENLKAQEYMNELYLSIKAGQPIENFLANLEKVEKERNEKIKETLYGKDAAEPTEKTLDTAPKSAEIKEPVNKKVAEPTKNEISSEVRKSTSYSNAYDLEDEVKKPEEKKFEDFKSDFSDFGDL